MGRLDNVITGKVIEPPRITIYGPHGIGKTTLGSNTPKPIIVATEKGAQNIDVPKFPRAETWQEAKQNIESLIEERHSYKTCVVDSLDWMERLIHAEVCREAGVTDIAGVPYQRGYVMALRYWGELVDLLDTLQEKRKMMILCLAHCKVKRFDAPDSDSYDRYELDLHEKANKVILQWCDAVLFATYRKYTTKLDAGFGKHIIKAMGTGERILYTEERPAYQAKNRYNLPSEIEFGWLPLGKTLKAQYADDKKKPALASADAEAAAPIPLGDQAPVTAHPVKFADGDDLPDEWAAVDKAGKGKEAAAGVANG